MQKRCVTSALRTVNTTDGKDIVKMACVTQGRALQ